MHDRAGRTVLAKHFYNEKNYVTKKTFCHWESPKQKAFYLTVTGCLF